METGPKERFRIFYFPKPSTKSHLQKGSKDKMRGCIKGGEGCWDKWLRVRVSIEGPLGGRLVRVCLANGNDGQMGLQGGEEEGPTELFATPSSFQ